MKVVFISHACVSPAHQKKLRALADKGDIELFLIAPRWWSEGAGRVELKAKGDINFTVLALPTLFTGKQFIHFYLSLAGHLKRIDPDIIHVEEEPNSASAFQAVWLKNRMKLRGKVILFTWQNMRQVWRFPDPRFLFYPFFERYTLKNTDYIIAGNKEGEKILIERGFRRKIKVLPQFGVDPEEFKKMDVKDLKKKLGLSSPVIGYLGRLVEAKGVRTLLKAAAGLKGDCQLLIIGDGPQKRVLMNIAAELGIKDRTLFIGSIGHKETPLYINCMDILALPSEHTPSWKEQFGRVLVEAMACEVPVVGSTCGEIPNVIGDGGVIFKEADEGELRKGLQRLISDKGLRMELGRKGRKRALGQYTTDLIAEETREAYRYLGFLPAAEKGDADGARSRCEKSHLNVCFVSGAYPPLNDGVGDYTAKLLSYLKPEGLQINLITSRDKRIIDGAEGQGGFNIFPIVRKWNLIGVMNILRLMRKKKFDLFHMQFPSTRYHRTVSLGLLPLLVKIISPSTKVVATLHEFSISYPVNKLRQLVIGSFSDRVVVTDDGDFNQISKGPGGVLIKDKLVTIPIGSNIDLCPQDAAEKEAFLKRFKLDPRTRVISFFGVIHSNKGLETLLKAMSELKDIKPPVFLVLIAELNAGVDPYHKRIQDMIDSLGIRDSMYLTGYRSGREVSKFLSISDICVLPFLDGATLRRGTLMAAFAHGLPVITTGSGRHVPKEFIDRSNIFLVPAKDSKALREAIVLLGEDSELRRRIGSAAKQLSKKFSWEKIAAGHIELYNDLFLEVKAG